MLHVWRDSIWRLNILKIAITVLQLLCGLGIILIVLFQSGKSAGLSGAIGGVADILGYACR